MQCQKLLRRCPHVQSNEECISITRLNCDARWKSTQLNMVTSCQSKCLPKNWAGKWMEVQLEVSIVTIFLKWEKWRIPPFGVHNEAALQSYIKKLHIDGGTVNRSIVMAASGIFHHNKGLLKEFGGTLEITHGLHIHASPQTCVPKRDQRSQTKSWLMRFMQESTILLKTITSCQIIWSSTGSKFVPCSEWMMDKWHSARGD